MTSALCVVVSGLRSVVDGMSTVAFVGSLLAAVILLKLIEVNTRRQ